MPERRVSGLDQPLAAPPCTSATGHNLPVRVTFQFLLVVCSVIELNGRYSASKLMTSLPQPGHEPPVGVTFQFLLMGAW